MRVVAGVEELEAVPRALAIGTFDGVHIGHRAVISRAVEVAAARGLRSAVVTFDRHPLEVVDPTRAPRLLISAAEKIRLIEELNPEELVLLHFNARLASLTPSKFCEELLADTLGARVVVVGENFHFGAGGAGDADCLRACGERHGYETCVVRLVTERGKTISSTRIRELLSRGELEEVRDILGRPPSASGLVVPGDRRGRTLGVPTANIDLEAGTIFPGPGVYAGRVLVAGGWYRAAVNIGHNPTFRSKDAPTTRVTVEAYLLTFSGDLYARPVRVDFLHRIRDERRFDSPGELVEQMRHDIAVTAGLADPAYVKAGI